jgi:rhodanese-related sulfurtransferase
MIKNIDVVELKEKLDSKESINIIDVRESWESEIANIPHSLLIPLSLLPLKANELEKEKEYVVYCHHGTRSYFACEYLSKNGFNNLLNLNGGIDEYSRKVDTNLKRY